MAKKPTPEQLQEVHGIAVELDKLGIKPYVQGNWVMFDPPPPFELLMRIQRLPKGLNEMLTADHLARGSGETERERG